MDKQGLVSVSLFYKNNKANGIGLTIHPDIYNVCQEQAEAAWRGMCSEIPADAVAAELFEQLDKIGRYGVRNCTDEEQVLVIMNILSLAEHGYLANDEYNGLQFAYLQSDSVAADTIADAMFS